VLLPNRLDVQNLEDMFTSETIAIAKREGQLAIPLANAFAHCSIALLSGLKK